MRQKEKSKKKMNNSAWKKTDARTSRSTGTGTSNEKKKFLFRRRERLELGGKGNEFTDPHHAEHHVICHKKQR